MLIMLASAALFVYLRLRADLDDRIDASLRSRAAAPVSYTHLTLPTTPYV